MPVSYTIDTVRGTITTRCVGDLTQAEVMQHFQELSLDPACPKYLNVLLDLTESNTTPDSAQLHMVIDAIRSLHERVRFEACAIVAARDAMYGMARMFAVFAEPYFRSLAVFREVREAQVWLEREIEKLTRSRREQA